MAERAKSKTAAKKAKKGPKGGQASRGKVAKSEPGPGHNSGGPSPALVKSHHEKISAIEKRMEAAKAKYDQIKGEHRSAYAVVKQDAIDVEGFKIARKLHAEDHGIVVTTYANVGTYLAAIQSELATQLDLFQELSNAPPHNATLAGAHAFRSGNDRTTNPYQQGTDQYVDFDAAWMEAANATNLTDGDGTTQH